MANKKEPIPATVKKENQKTGLTEKNTSLSNNKIAQDKALVSNTFPPPDSTKKKVGK